ncbi:MAG: hypothetical protein AAGA85_11590 [Bacteroidota bacterium]
MDELPDFDHIQQAFQERLARFKAEQGALGDRTVEVNRNFAPVWERLLDLGYAQDLRQESGELSREAFRDHLEKDIRQMDALLSKVADGDQDVVTPCLRHIATMFERLQDRWNSILHAQQANKKAFAEVASTKQQYVTKFGANDARSGLNEEEMQGLLLSFLGLFEEEEQILKRSQQHLVELNHLLEVKERLLQVALDLLPK